MGGLILDIDDTLTNTAFWVTRAVLEQFPCDESDDAAFLVKKYLQPGFVPSWQTPEIQAKISTLFNEPFFLETLPPFEEAVTTLKKVTVRRPVKLYLSSRVKNLHTVTEKWLAQNGFPPAPVILRHSDEFLPAWKLHYLHTHAAADDVFIDNEIGFLQVEKVEFQGRLIWFNRYSRAALLTRQQLTSVSSWLEIEEVLA